MNGEAEQRDRKGGRGSKERRAKDISLEGKALNQEFWVLVPTLPSHAV